MGGNAKAVILSGGGSASLKPSYFVSPYEGIVAALKEADPNVEITYSEGARGTYLACLWLVRIGSDLVSLISIHDNADARFRHAD